MLLSIVVFIVILGLLIFVHEFGHFLVAKLIGVKVEEFAFGFPPRLIKIKKGETVYSVNLIPLGGFVRLTGEFGEEMLGWRGGNQKSESRNQTADSEAGKNDRNFHTKPIWGRLAVVVAGVAMNWVTAVILITTGFTVGMAPLVTAPERLGGRQKPLIIIAQVNEGSPAHQASLKPGDQLMAGEVLGQRFDFQSVQDVQSFTKSHRGQLVDLTIKRLDSGESITQTVNLSSSDAGPLGIGLFETAIVRLSPLKALGAALTESWLVTKETVLVFGQAIGQLFQGKVVQEVGGPVLIYSATAQAVKLGFGAVIALASVLSINLAIINIIPFPALDGGRALFIVLEGLFRKPVIRQRYEQIIHAAGFAILILLILAITYRDIIRIR